LVDPSTEVPNRMPMILNQVRSSG